MGFLYSQLFVTPAVPKSNLSGQTVIVTGANVGLGFEAAKHLARMGASNIILGCRDVKKGEYAAAVVARTPGAEKAQVEVWPLDLGSYSSVEKFASRAEALPRLDSVIQNAGILTANFNLMEGNESNLHVNVYSPMYLTMLLLPKLRESAKQNKKDGRVTFVGSEMFMWAKFQEKKLPGNTLENMNSKKDANMGDRYGVSKLIQLMDTRAFAEATPVSDQSPVIISNVTPGFCKSDVFRDAGFGHKMMKFMQNLIGRQTEVGSRTLVDAVSPVHGREIHGAFLWDCQPVTPAGYITSKEGNKMQGKVWKETVAKLDAVKQGISQSL